MPRPTPDRGPRTPGGASETLVFGGMIVIAVVCALVLAGAHVATALFGHGTLHATLADAGAALVNLPRHLGNPAEAWPLRSAEALPGAVPYYASLVTVVAPVTALCIWGLGRYQRSRGRDGLGVERSARFARRGDMRRLVVTGPEKGRLLLGRVEGHLVAAERRASLCLVGPTESGKTSGVAVPIILERGKGHGPIIAATVKGDLYDVTARRRAEVGDVKIFDPTGILAARARAEGRPAEAVTTATWSPLRMCRTITGAQSAARALTDVAARSGLEGADFFMGAAKELLWSVLYAAAAGGFDMRHVVRWVTIQDRPHYNRQGLVVRPSEMEQILTVAAADPTREAEATQALEGLRGVWELDERSRSSIFATARIVIEAWSDPVVAAASASCDITPEWLLGGDNTLYIVAPARDQGRFRPVFACMVADLVNAAFDCANRSKGGELALPLLVLLDEAANICPVRELPTWCSTCASHGIQLVHVWQDRSQQRARYGREGAETIWNNSAAKIICSGLADAATGEVTQLLGEEETERRGWSADVGGPRRSVSTQTMHRRLVSADSMRRQQPGQALLIYKHLPPSALSLRLWYRDTNLRALQEGRTGGPTPTGRGRRAPPAGGANVTMGAAVAGGDHAVPAWSVGELLEAARLRIAAPHHLEAWVVGCVSGLCRRRGHLFFDLAEADAAGAPAPVSVPVAVLGRAAERVLATLAAAEVELADGLQVRLWGRLGIYVPRARLELVATAVDPATTVGAAALARQRLLRTLRSDHLLEANGRCELVALPLRVGIVGPAGAGRGDVTAALEASGYSWRLTCATVPGEGPRAAPAIAWAIGATWRAGVDVVLVVRGGGAAVDLSPFDDERVARAVARCPRPVWVAVGHQSDRSVADACAHRSFATPSSAAAALVATVVSLETELDAALATIAREGGRVVEAAIDGVEAEAATIVRHAREVVVDHRARVDVLEATILGLGRTSAAQHRARLVVACAAVVVVVLIVLVVGLLARGPRP